MNTLQTTNLYPLPLSWARTQTAVPSFQTIKLPLTATQWVPLAEIPHTASFEQIYQEHLAPKSEANNVVLQSVSLSLRDYLRQKGWQAAAMGAEAILDLPWRGKRSVRELARRGRRHGAVHEMEHSDYNQSKLTQLIHHSPSRKKVQLNYTERPNFDESARLFAFETAEGQWLGAVTLSTNSATYAHTELLIRHQEAPIGIMEALITAIAQKLTDEGFTQLSLGSVPVVPTTENDTLFTPYRHQNDLWRRSQLMFKLGQRFNFAYNAAGLWRFKNKFSPRWEPLYLVASSGISWLMVAELIQATGYVGLVQSNLLNLWPPFLNKFKWPRRAERKTAVKHPVLS